MAKYGWKRRGDVLRNMAWYTHKVKSGDTLASIAKSVKPAQTVAYLKKWNGLATDKVTAGQTIKVYPYYVVQWGDTLGDIAKSFGTTYQKLHTVNPWIKNVNKIYPKEKIRLLEGMEPEEKVPDPPAPPPPPPPPPPPKKEDPPKTAGEGNDRTGAAPDYDNDDLPAHRKTAGDYFLRIGDCQFVIPPEFINVQKVNTINQGGFMRQKESFKYKNGQSETRIELQLWFNSLEEINGFEVPSPIEGQKFFMDGLRPLIAQFKRQPFLPIINEYLNDVLDIHVIAFSNMSFTTVEGFPDAVQVNLTLYKMEVDMYIGKPTWTYDQHFMYPLFRWYYNQMLVTDKPMYSTTYLKPVEWASFTDDVKFKIINEGFLRETKATNKMKDIDLDEIAYETIDLPDDLHCTGIFGSFGTILQPIQMDMRENATFQYMGGGDTQFYLTFETMNRDAIAVLDRLYSTLERYSRNYRDKFVSGYAQIDNSIINMAGVTNIMIQDMTVSTVPGQPDLFRIQMSVVSYRDTQYQDQRLKGAKGENGGFNIVSDADASEVMEGNMGTADKYLHEKTEPWFITEEGLAEGMLDQLELYPDLELPTYAQLNHAIKTINTYRRRKGYEPLPIKNDEFKTPAHYYRHFKSGSIETEYMDDSIFVDPDFYYTYPEWSDIKWIDSEFIDDAALDIKLGLEEGYSKKTQGSGETVDGNDRRTQIFYWAEAKRKEWNLPEEAYYFLLSIALHETAFGTTGQGREPKNMILGYGSYDSNPDYSYGGIEKQMHYGAKRISDALKSKGYIVKSEADVKYFWQGGDYGSYQWASDVHWPSGVWKAYQQITNDKDSYKPPSGISSDGTSGGSAPVVRIADPDILKDAQADIIMPIPKDHKEEQDLDIEQGQISDGAVMKGMLHDMAKFSRRGSMVRAFPSYVLCFVDEGMWVDYRRLWNNYYTYHAVEELAVVKERNNPVDLATIRLQNIYGALNSTNRADVKATNEATKLPGWTNIFKHPGETMTKWFNAWFPKATGELVSQRQKHIEKSGFYLRTGARVHIRMGYGSVASHMPITFNGRITEIDVGDIAECICQSDGLELIEPYHEWGGDSRKTWTSLKQEPKDIIDDFLVNRDGWDALGNYSNPFVRSAGTKSKYGIEHFGYVQAEDPSGFWDGWFTDMVRSWVGREVVNGYDVRKNIYTANGHGKTSDAIWDDETNIHFWETNKSPWDVMMILTSVIPDYELKVHEHNFHSTLFYGEPHWYIKYGYFVLGKDTTKRSSWYEKMKPSQQFHHYDSMFDICTNKVKASDKNICTVAVPVYSWDEQPRSGETLFADPNIKPEMQKTDIVDTSLLQDYPMGDFIADVLRWTGHNGSEAVSGALEAGANGIGKLLGWEETLDLDSWVMPKHNRVERLAIEAAKTHIQWKFRSMYQGDLVVLGDTAVRPGDMINISDVYTQMFGQAEVGRVVHVMGMGQGFLTTIKPDLLAVRKDGKRAKLLPQWSLFATYMSLRTLRFVARKYIIKKPMGFTAKLTKATGFLKNIRNVRNTAASTAIGVSAAAGPPGWIAVVAELALWVVSELIIDGIESAINQQRAGVTIMPLWYKNRPYVAGIDGHKELIPGYWDENIYGEILDNPEGPGTSSGGGGATFVPEGYQFCLPTSNQSLTSPYGPRTHPVTGKLNSFHTGVDYAPLKRGVDGDPIYNFTAGKVVEANTNAAKNGYGRYVIVEHELSEPITWTDTWLPNFAETKLYKFYTMYAHLSKVGVSAGQEISTGHIVGEMGTTGTSTNTHLHFEFRTHYLILPSNKLNGWGKSDHYDPQQLFTRIKAYQPKSS